MIFVTKGALASADMPGRARWRFRLTLSPQQLVADIAQLASFPEVALRLDTAVADARSGAKEIAAIVTVDPALTASLLRIANSPLYSMSGHIDSIERAVTIVGIRELRDMAFGVCAADAFRGIPNELVSVEDFWRHSLSCAVIAQHLADRARACRGQSLFTAGLLHDIGHLVMFNQCPDQSREALERSIDEADGLTPYLAEQKIFGFDHAAVGAALAREWCFPAGLLAAIEYHHDPFGAPEASDAAVIVHIANSCAVLAELEDGRLSDAPAIDGRAFMHLGLDVDIVDATVAAAKEAVPELLKIFAD